MIQLVAVGDVLANKYRVDKVLGVGGMGMVVAATHRELDQKVAIKFMLPAALTSTLAVDRFMREARAAVRLKSEHVCRVLDVGKLEESSNAPYIVMELMEGEDLAQLIRRRGPLPLGEAVDLLLQALEGIAEAHANAIVHRDLKPGNLFVATDGDGSPLVKVLDFGISKSAVGGAATQTGDVMGSPSYMAPEQMKSSKDVDVRADIWALGVIGFEMASGKLPFEQDNLAALCMAVLNDPAPRLDTVGRFPPAFVDIIARCLERERDARYSNVGDLAAALAPFGGPSARADATRIGKMLRRHSGQLDVPGGVAPTMLSTAETVAPTQAPAAMAVAASAPRDSTFRGSAGEVVSAAPLGSPFRARAPLVIGLLSLAAVATMFVLMATNRHGSESPPSNAAAVVSPPPSNAAAVGSAPPSVDATPPPPVAVDAAVPPPDAAQPAVATPAVATPATPPAATVVPSHQAKPKQPPATKPPSVAPVTPDAGASGEVDWSQMSHDSKQP